MPIFFRSATMPLTSMASRTSRGPPKSAGSTETEALRLSQLQAFQRGLDGQESRPVSHLTSRILVVPWIDFKLVQNDALGDRRPGGRSEISVSLAGRRAALVACDHAVRHTVRRSSALPHDGGSGRAVAGHALRHVGASGVAAETLHEASSVYRGRKIARRCLGSGCGWSCACRDPCHMPTDT